MTDATDSKQVLAWAEERFHKSATVAGEWKRGPNWEVLKLLPGVSCNHPLWEVELVVIYMLGVLMKAAERDRDRPSPPKMVEGDVFELHPHRLMASADL